MLKCCYNVEIRGLSTDTTIIIWGGNFLFLNDECSISQKQSGVKFVTSF